MGRRASARECLWDDLITALFSMPFPFPRPPVGPGALPNCVTFFCCCFLSLSTVCVWLCVSLQRSGVSLVARTPRNRSRMGRYQGGLEVNRNSLVNRFVLKCRAAFGGRVLRQNKVRTICLPGPIPSSFRWPPTVLVDCFSQAHHVGWW